MSEKEKYPSEMAERFQVRLPLGLRDRIKAYAERHGRSMNTEIVRVLEREFPEQWHIDDRIAQLGEMLTILGSGTTDPRLDEFVTRFRETVEGIVSGRVVGVDAETRGAVANMWREYTDRLSEAAYEAARDAQMDFSPDEIAALELVGRPEKYALEPAPIPNPSYDAIALASLLPAGLLAEFRQLLERGEVDAARQKLRNLTKEQVQMRKLQAEREERAHLHQSSSDDFPAERD